MGKLFCHSIGLRQPLAPPRWGIHEKCDSSQDVDERFSFGTGEIERWGQGDALLGLPPPLGERGGHSHSLSKRLESDRISTEPIFLITSYREKTDLIQYFLFNFGRLRYTSSIGEQ